MAIIHCPGCSRRISDKNPACPHCDLALGQLAPEDLERLARRRWQRRVWRARNVIYLAMTALVAGAIWWWVAEPGGWVLPPPLPAMVMMIAAGLGYVAGRAWLFWLQLGRNRPGA